MSLSTRRAWAVVLLLAAAGSVRPRPCAGDWPTYRADNARSGTTAEHLSLPLTRAWTYSPTQRPAPAWPEPGKELHRMDFDYAPQPVAANGRVYFGSSADDSVRALDAATGRGRWCFTTGGPVRFAPALAGGKCYVASDDGWVYCLDAETGKLAWKFRAAPRGDQLLGNGRMISRWPIRTGVLVADDPDKGGRRKVAYFAAGMWPSLGIHVCAVDAASGEELWRNDASGSMYIQQPHSRASAFTGVCPQGYLLASKDLLFVPTGRSVPAAFDRRTGRLRYYHPAGNKFEGGCWAAIAGDVLLNPGHPRLLDQPVLVGEAQPDPADGMCAHLLTTGFRQPQLRLPGRHRVLLAGDALYAVGSGRVDALDAKAWRAGRKSADRLRWTAGHGRAYSLALAGRSLLVGGARTVTAFDTRTGEPTWRGTVDGQARGLAVDGGRVFVATHTGRIVCFEPRRVIAAPRAVGRTLSWTALPPGRHASLAADVLRRTGVSEGCALVVGSADSRLAAALAAQSNLHVLCVVRGQAAARAERRRLLSTDLYGRRVAVQGLDRLDALPYAPYFADLVVVAGQAERLDGAALYRVLRPCGGVMCLAVPGKRREALVRGMELPAGEAWSADGPMALLRRGPLPGSGEWRHQWADGGRSGFGTDRRIRLPLELLWFGGPGPDRMMDRHWATSTPLAARGRVFVTGQHHVIAFDAYNGREHWARRIDHVGRSGTVFSAGNFVADDDSLYVVKGAVCHRLDQATGRDLAAYSMPRELMPAETDRAPAPAPAEVDWPETWQVFGPMPKGAPLPPADRLRTTPESLTVAGKKYLPRALRTVHGALDLTYLYGGFGLRPLQAGERPTAFPRGRAKRDRAMERKVACAFAEIRCRKAGRLTIGAGANWWMAWYLDGKRVYDTLREGNGKSPPAVTDHVFSTEVSAGRHVLAVAALAGSRGWSVVSAGGAEYEPLLAAASAPPQPRWGYVSVAGDLLLGSYVPPGHWGSEAAALFALDCGDGRTRWVYRASRRLGNAAIAYGDGRVFVLEGPPWEEITRAWRRGLSVHAKQTLVALDLRSGSELWRRDDVPMTQWRMLQCARGVVVVCGTAAYQAATGRDLWRHDGKEFRPSRPPVVAGEWLITHPGAVALATGRRRQVTDLLTGRQRPWQYVRAYGCGSVVGCGELLLFRSGTAGFLDLARDATTTFGGVRPGCSLSMVAAGGLVVLPEGSSGCTCSYSFQTSVALVPRGGSGEDWYVFAGRPAAGPVRRLRLNFGAPGDRRCGQAAWLGLPRPVVSGAYPAPVQVQIKRPSWRRLLPLATAVPGTDCPWIYRTALCGEGKIVVNLLPDAKAVKAARKDKARGGEAPATRPAERTFTVRLHFLEAGDVPPGGRVFDVSLQGRVVLDDFDVARAAGGRGRAVVREFPAVKARGKLTLSLASGRGEPLLCGMEVLER